MRIDIFNNNFIYVEREYCSDTIYFDYYNRNIVLPENDNTLDFFIACKSYGDFYLTDLYYFLCKKIIDIGFNTLTWLDSHRYSTPYVIHQNVLNKELVLLLVNKNPLIITRINKDSLYGYYSVLRKAFLKDNTIIGHYRFNYAVPKKYKIRLYKEFKNIIDSKELKEKLKSLYYLNLDLSFKYIFLT